MKYISLFSGIEAASAAWGRIGWSPICFAEIEAFPCAVLQYHYPSVPNVGDMTKHDWYQYRGKCDVFVSGPPCQAFSVAGLRKSLDDERGNLSLENVRAIHAVDPVWSVTENVPGWLSTKDNAFGCFLGALVGSDDAIAPPAYLGKWSDCGVVAGPKRTAAWRILDAQFFGVAQRRRRVFVLSVRGFRNWACADALFPVSESLSGNPAPSREEGKNIAGPLTRCAPGGRMRCDSSDNEHFVPIGVNCFGEQEVTTCLSSKNQRLDGDTETFVAHALTRRCDSSEDGCGRGTPLVPVAVQEDNQNGVTMRDTTGSLRSDAPGTQPRGTLAMVPIAITTEQTPKWSNDQALTLTKQSPTGGGQPQAVVYGFDPRQDPNSSMDCSEPLDTQQPGKAVAFTQNQCGEVLTRQVSTSMGPSQNATGRNTPQVCYPINTQMAIHRESLEGNREGLGLGDDGDPAFTVLAAHPHGVAMSTGVDVYNGEITGDVAATFGAKSGISNTAGPKVITHYAVRRLTPLECERLQGFPDGYTLVDYRGKPAADGPRYRALGNSMAVPVMAWIGKRIQMVDEMVNP